MSFPPPRPTEDYLATQRAKAAEEHKKAAFPMEIKMLQMDINNLGQWVLDIALAGKLNPRSKQNLQTYLNIIKDRIENL